MKIQTLKNRLAKTNHNKATVAYKMVDGLGVSKKGYILRTCYTSGRRRFTTNQDHTDAVSNLLTACKVKHEIGNDSPRGGKTGNYIRILVHITA